MDQNNIKTTCTHYLAFASVFIDFCINSPIDFLIKKKKRKTQKGYFIKDGHLNV